MRTVKINLGKGRVCVIDEADLTLIKPYEWRSNGRYAHGFIPIGKNGMKRGIIRTNKSRVWMHRLIMGAKDTDPEVDHIDGNGLNNSRSNLRFASRSQNSANSKDKPRKLTPYRGLGKNHSGWMAKITVNYTQIYGGTYKHEYNAAQAYNFLAEEYFGQFARFNTPIEGYIA